MKLKVFSFLLVLLFPLTAPAGLSLQDFSLIRSDPALRAQLQEVIGSAVRKAFGEKGSPPKNLSPLFLKASTPVFITAKKGEEVRGCMGSLNPKKGSLAEEIEHNLRLAFLKDPRHRPILREEVGGLEIFVTAVGEPSEVSRWDSLVPARDAILLKSGEKASVVLPGEAKTLRYLKAFARAKAGIRKGEAYQIFKLKTESVSVKLSADIFSKAP